MVKPAILDGAALAASFPSIPLGVSVSKKPANNNNLPSLQELQQIQRNLPKLPDDMDPKKKRLIYGLLTILAIIALIFGTIYVNKNGTDGLFGSEDTTSSAEDEEASDVPTETLAEVKNPYKAVDPATALAPDLATAKKELASLAVKDRAPKTGYSREQFGRAWDDVDGNKCNTRDDILRRDMTNLRFKVKTHACTVISGTLADPYTGKTIEFKRGKKTSSAVQIDHVVALSNAWQTGAQDLSAEQRRQLANDPENLLAADGPANQQKSDADAAEWLPSNTAYRCTYVARQVHVKAKYKLWVTADEKKVMERTLDSCKDTNPTKK